MCLLSQHLEEIGFTEQQQPGKYHLPYIRVYCSGSTSLPTGCACASSIVNIKKPAGYYIHFAKAVDVDVANLKRELRQHVNIIFIGILVNKSKKELAILVIEPMNRSRFNHNGVVWPLTRTRHCPLVPQTQKNSDPI